MTCKHCGTNHPKSELPCEWPANWTTARRRLFVIDAGFLGFNEADARVMAVEQEKVNRHTRYEVGERDVLIWINEARLMAGRMAALEASRTRWLGWSALPPLKPEKRLWMAALQFMARVCNLALTAPPLMLVTVPLRLVFAFRAWMLRRRFYPLFNEWIAANKKRRA